MARSLCYLLVAANALIFWAAVYLPVGGESARVPVVPDGVQILQRVGEEAAPTAVWPGQDTGACYRLAGFSSPGQARQWLQEQDVAPDVFEIKPQAATTPPYYWVLQSPDNNAVDAVRDQVVRYQNDGLDSYLVSEGPWQGRISFGLYSEPERASTRLNELRDQGIDAEVVARPREPLFYAIHGGESLAQIGAPPYLTKSGTLITLQPCEGVAKPRQNP